MKLGPQKEKLNREDFLSLGEGNDAPKWVLAVSRRIKKQENLI